MPDDDSARGGGDTAAPDALTLLREQHAEVEELFTSLERLQPIAQGSEQSHLAERTRLMELLVRKLMTHANIEESHFYPLVAEHIADGDELVEQSVRQHREAEALTARLDGMSPDNVDFDTQLRELILDVRTHVRLEETEVFPRIEAALGPQRLGQLGAELAKAAKRVPTRPHPHTPPATTGMGRALAKGAAVVDRLRDAASGRGRG